MFEETFQRLLNRPVASHKYDFGHVLIIGGSPGMVGAPFLSARAALRIGAGLVTIASSAEVVDKLEKRVEEIMTFTISTQPNKVVDQLEDFINKHKVNVLAVGPGLNKDRFPVARKITETTNLPMVIDGGGLSALQDNLDILKNIQMEIILTPHIGEFKRLVGRDIPKNQNDLKDLATEFVKTNSVILVLKGHPTFVADQAGQVYVNKTGGPGLATAGTGDVLSGMIAGIIAQGIEPLEAAKAGVYLHGLASDLVAAKKTEPGLIASDVIEAIPAALKTLV